MRICRKQKSGRMAFMAVGLFIAFFSISLFIAGCGSDDDAGPSGTGTVTDDGLDRSEPGKVTARDAGGDARSTMETGAPIPVWLDIEAASVATDGENMIFEMVLAEPFPQQKPEEIIGIELGFHIDTDSDGQPDFGLYAAYPNQSLTYGLFNHGIQQRLADTLFPGSFKAEGNTITWTFEAGAIASPAKFQWAAYTDAGSSSGGDQPQLVKTGDKLPDNGWPGGGWFVFP